MNRKVLHVLIVAVFASMIGFGIMAPLLPEHAKELGANGVWIAIIGVSFSASRGIFMPIVGKISDKTGRKRFIAVGLLIYSLLSLAYIPADTLYSLTAVRFLHGVGSAMVIPIAMAYIGETSEKGKEGTSMGALNVAIYMGLGAGPLLGGFLNDAYGFNSAFYALAGLSGIAFVIVLAYLPATTSLKASEEEIVPMSRIIRDDTMKGIFVFRFMNAMAFAGALWFLPVLSDEVFDATSTQQGLVLSADVFITGLAQIPFGWVADRHNKLRLVLIGSLVIALSSMFAGQAPSLWLLVVLAAAMGLGSAVSLPAASAIAVIKVGEKGGMGIQMGLLNMAMSTGMVAGPLIMGAVRDAWGIDYIFLVLGAISLLSTAVFCYLSRKELKSRQLEPL